MSSLPLANQKSNRQPGTSFKGSGLRYVLALALLLPATMAHALSTACSTLNANSGTTSYTNRFATTDFDSGESVTFSYTDNGQGTGGSPVTSNIVNLRSRTLSTTYSDYRSNTGSAGPHSATVSSSQLKTGGLYVQISTGTYISAVAISCSGAVAADATLSGLTLSAGTLTPAFSAGTTSYSATVSNSTASVMIRPTATASDSTITVNGGPVASGADSSAISLAVGTNSITVISTAADGQTSKSYSITVTRAEAAPVASDVTATVAANTANNPVTLAITGTPTSVAVASAASHGTATASGTSITYSPAAGYSGSDSFTYIATNTSGTSAPATVSVTVSRPTLAVTPASGALPGGQVGVSYNQTISSSGGSSPYTYAATGLPTGLTLDATSGVISGSPTTAGSYALSINATDANGATGTASYTLAIAVQAPVAGAVSATVAANSSANTVPLNLSGGAATSAAIASVPSHGTATVSGLVVTYTPAPGYSGTDSFTYTVSNATGTSAPATVSVTVSRPTLAVTPASGALPGGQVGVSYSQTISSSGGSRPYTYAATGLPTGLTLDATSGVISGSPTTAGSYALSINATDANGATGTASYTLAIAVQPPVAGAVSATVAANSSANTVPLNLSGGAATSAAIASVPSHGTATVSGLVVTYTPAPGYSGTDSFTYTVTNATGTSAPATVTITVTAAQLTFTPGAGTLSGGEVGASYSQSINAAGGTAPYRYSASGLPTGLTLNTASGVISGAPTTAGSYTTSIIATDANGATGTASYTLTIAVNAPVAGAVLATVAANSNANSVPLNLSGGDATSAAIASVPSHGTATVSGLVVTYTPARGYSGTDSFTYTVSNTTGTSAPATVTITVTAAQLTFSPSAGALPGGQVGVIYSQSISAASGTAPYRYSANGLPSGLALDASTGLISGTPTVTGAYSFSVTATDSASNNGSVSYNLAVTAPLPAVAPVSATVAANSSNNAVALALSGGTATAVTVVSGPAHGNAVASGTSIRYTPNAGYSGTDSFTYSASNASGASDTATVTVTVTAAAMALSPSAGALTAATVGSSYRQVFSATGGVTPYRFNASGLPAGLSLDATTGTLTGTPTAAGSAALTLTATDANGTRITANYSLTVNGTAPKAADTTVTVDAGQSVSVDLSAGATGGPFTSATLEQLPAQNMGTSRLDLTRLSFTAASKASGILTLRFTLANQWGTSQPATLTLQINARPDPSHDAEVVGVLNAQAQSAEQFAKAQISNFNDRLEQLHSRDGHNNAFNLRFNVAQAQAKGTRGQTDSELNALDTLALLQTAPNAPPPILQAAEDKSVQAQPKGDVSVWTGGYVDFGDTRQNGSKVSNTTFGVSSGIDYRLSRALTVGLGVGYGSDKSDIGSAGSTSRGESYSAALYASYHPSAVFVDALFGYSRLTFDSERYVTDSARSAKGSRNGDQLFGSLSSGYEMKGENWLFSPYGRLDTSTTWLRGFSESDAESSNLAYAPQRLSLLSSVAGLRGQYGVPLGWAYLNLRSRLEYSHTFNGTSTARLGYVDVGDSTYSITTKGFGDNTMSGTLGVDFLWASGLTTGFAYQGTRAIGEASKADGVSVRVAYQF